MAIPLLIAGLVAGAGAAAASAAGSAAGIGKNGEKVKEWKPGMGNVKGPNAGTSNLFGQGPQVDQEIARQRFAAQQWAEGPQQFRTDQEGLIDQLKLQAAGQGPSAAQAQLQSAKDQTMAQQMAMAAGARGSSALAGAQQAAQFNAAQASQQAGAQSAALRAQEQQQATQNLAGVLGQARQQDMGDADRFAQMTQFYERMGLDTRTAQLQAAMAMEQMKLQAQQMDADVFLRTQGQRLDQGAQNAAADAKMFGAGVGGVANAIGSIGSGYASINAGKGGK
jgi:hypothetical protein